MTSTTTLDVPEQGQLVEVRQPRYVVSDVARRALTPSPLDTGDNGRSQHLVSFSSVDFKRDRPLRCCAAG